MADPEPEVDQQIALYIQAWHDLNTCRHSGFGSGPIPWTAAMEWADRYDLDDEAARLLWAVVCYLEQWRVAREETKRALDKHHKGRR